MKYTLPFVETMVTQACNLSCEGCTNYSDYNVANHASWDNTREMISAWLNRVDILDFGLIGGEPLLNKDLAQWVTGCRELMPSAQLRLTTNGKLLMRRKDILDTVFDVGNCVFKITVHEPNEFYVQEIINLVFNYAEWEPVVEYGIHRWKSTNNVRFQLNFPKTFYKTFVGSYSQMLPHNSVPAEAFSICCQQTCPLLYNGKIYKCSSIALLEKTLSDWQQQSNLWQPYLDYKGISADCSNDELSSFISNFGAPENICSMCPSSTDSKSKIDHYSTVMPKSKWIQIHNVSN